MNKANNTKIGILDYGVGNLGSVYSAFKFYSYDVCLIQEPELLSKVDLVVIAGVGNFTATVTKLKELGFWEALQDIPKDGKPILGICLGMQLFANLNHEEGRNKGLGWIEGEVVKLESRVLRVPHIGWDKVEPADPRLFKHIKYNFFYFMHSYHFIPKDRSVVKAITNYNGFEIVSVVGKSNIVGVQFHPEKSQGDGLRFLRNFVEAVL